MERGKQVELGRSGSFRTGGRQGTAPHGRSGRTGAMLMLGLAAPAAGAHDAYVANYDYDSVAIIDTRTNSVVGQTAVAAQPNAFVIVPDQPPRAALASVTGVAGSPLPSTPRPRERPRRRDRRLRMGLRRRPRRADLRPDHDPRLRSRGRILDERRRRRRRGVPRLRLHRPDRALQRPLPRGRHRTRIGVGIGIVLARATGEAGRRGGGLRTGPGSADGDRRPVGPAAAGQDQLQPQPPPPPEPRGRPLPHVPLRRRPARCPFPLPARQGSFRPMHLTEGLPPP